MKNKFVILKLEGDGKIGRFNILETDDMTMSDAYNTTEEMAKISEQTIILMGYHPMMEFKNGEQLPEFPPFPKVVSLDFNSENKSGLLDVELAEKNSGGMAEFVEFERKVREVYGQWLSKVDCMRLFHFATGKGTLKDVDVPTDVLQPQAIGITDTPDLEDIVFLNDTIYPSEDRTVAPVDTDDSYGGAHTYLVKKCAGFENGQTQYPGGITYVQFVRKHEDGTVTPGLQNEQVFLILIDRMKKLNARFPHPNNLFIIDHLNICMELSKQRVIERMDRGVMGKLEK